MAKVVGQPLDRIDGRLKVTGKAVYAADVRLKGLAHAVLVTSTIARGRITGFDNAAAERSPGVLAVLTHLNAPRLPEKPGKGAPARPGGRKLDLLQEGVVRYANQPIALVVAETIEQAMYAASLVRPRYEAQRPILDLGAERPRAYRPKSLGGNKVPADTNRGDLARGLADAAARIEQTYTTPPEFHNPLEPHATVAVWDGPHLTLHDATQAVHWDRDRVASLLGKPASEVRLICPVTGGGFGSKGPTWSHVVLAALAAKHVRRPVKLVLTRQQMFGPVGHRSPTVQKLTLGASARGALTAVRHDGIAQTSAFDEFPEPTGVATRMIYACPNIATTHRLVRLNTGTPSYMRAPGEAPGMFALESALDELAYELKIDPVELRLRNYADRDPEDDKHWSSKSLRACYLLGARMFGWDQRKPKPRSQHDGDELIGWGMATATYPVRRSPSSAVASLLPDGTAFVRSGSQDLGGGTGTIMTQIAADALGLPPSKVRFELGDSRLPETPVSGGSQTAASTGSAVLGAARALRRKVIGLATSDMRSPLHGAAEEGVGVEDGRLFRKDDRARGETYRALLGRHGGRAVEARIDSKPGKERDKVAMYSFGAHFAEVRVQPDLGRVRVTRFVGAFGVGKVLNAKTARNQLTGGIVFGISMALFERGVRDGRRGNIINANLGDYLVPVSADVPAIQVAFVDEVDPLVNPVGVKGIGELGIVGSPAAVANAVYHATGKRIRDLPITVEKLLERDKKE